MKKKKTGYRCFLHPSLGFLQYSWQHFRLCQTGCTRNRYCLRPELRCRRLHQHDLPLGIVERVGLQAFTGPAVDLSAMQGDQHSRVLILEGGAEMKTTLMVFLSQANVRSSSSSGRIGSRKYDVWSQDSFCFSRFRSCINATAFSHQIPLSSIFSSSSEIVSSAFSKFPSVWYTKAR